MLPGSSSSKLFDFEVEFTGAADVCGFAGTVFNLLKLCAMARVLRNAAPPQTGTSGLFCRPSVNGEGTRSSAGDAGEAGLAERSVGSAKPTVICFASPITTIGAFFGAAHNDVHASKLITTFFIINPPKLDTYPHTGRR